MIFLFVPRDCVEGKAVLGALMDLASTAGGVMAEGAIVARQAIQYETNAQKVSNKRA